MLAPNPRARAKESICLYGEYGSGKSKAWTTLAALYRATDTPGTFHVIETVHEASHVVLEVFDDWESNVVIHEALDYDTLMETGAKIAAEVEPHDWLVVESMDNVQKMVRDLWFTEHRDGMSWREYQASGASPKEIKPADWITMDEAHAAFTTPYVLGLPCHKLATAAADVVHTEQGFSDNKMVRQMFERIGVKPRGHKSTGYVFRSILLTRHPAKTDWTLTTVDDPEREHLENAIVAPPPLGFAKSYLLEIAHWSLAPEDWTVLLPLMRGDAS